MDFYKYITKYMGDGIGFMRALSKESEDLDRLRRQVEKD